MVLRAENIYKTIKNRIILNNVSLELSGGNVYAFMGENGSGKTMLFRALSGLMNIDSGLISFNGKVLHKDFNVIPSLGIMLENAGLFPDKTGYDNLLYLSKLRNLIGKEEITDSLLRVGLNPNDKRLYKKYSLGMKQRLIIAQAIMERPDVLMLDEPTNSLDSKGIELFRKIILEEKKRGAMVLIASHIKEDINLLADEVYFISSGKISKMKNTEG